MIKNYIKIAWRNILREKGYAFVNVFGLSIGIAFCILIYLFVQDELTFDQFHQEGDQIFRVEETTLYADGSQSTGTPTGPVVLGPALQSEISGIEEYIRIQHKELFVRVQGSSSEALQENVLFADPSLLTVFTFPLQSGDPLTALENPDHVVLTREMAGKYFGDENPVGKTMEIRLNQQFESFVVSGVAQNIPGNSTIQFGILLPFQRLLMFDEAFKSNADSWHFYSAHTYVQLNSGSRESQIESNLPAFYEKYHATDIAQEKEAGRYDSTETDTYNLNPIQEIHLTRDSDPSYSIILSGIAIAVLIIACINFMTLSIGRSVRRATEVGVRKVVGADRKQLMVQFWGEAFFLSSIALALGVMMAEIFLPVFNQLTDKSLEINMAANSITILVLTGLLIITSFISGSYPALLLSGFKPVDSLSKHIQTGKTGIFSKSLIVFQFTVTVFLITSTLIMSRQLAYTRSIDLGFNNEQVVVIPTSGLDAGEIAQKFRNRLGQETSIVGITASGNELGRTGTMGMAFPYKDKHVAISVFRVDPYYIDFLGLNLVAGRDFDVNRDMASNRAVIVDEALVRDLEIEDPVGQTIPFPWAKPGEGPEIIGVVKDYHFQSLYQEVGPLMLTLDPNWYFEQMLVRIRPDNIPSTLDLLKETWQGTVSELPFTYHFLDDQMQTQYANDRRWSEIIRYAAMFSVLIACLGLLGLTALTVSRRTKEIGIRKVLGAKVHHIVTLISREFAMLILLGVVVATPLAYIIMQNWLTNFAYRVPLSVWFFLAAGFGALAIALLTVGYHAVKSALANPVKSLRSE
ncbi:ABC transporter permease [Rhodohalobacter sp. 614A]|uniref:ABC transporter permease n=1 Tax=Rhodohalobacter sp. 614A TaxID=2908649 RepID=UPI001F33B5F4|nr:ABC transporter permease [Rhodohalobacter sp. 614A]